MTEADKKKYEKKHNLKPTVNSKFSGMKLIQKIGIVLGTLCLLGLIAATSYMFYIRNNSFIGVVGKNFERVSWSNNDPTTAEELKRWRVKKTFPGTLGDVEDIECTFFNKKDDVIGKVKFLGHDNLCMYEGQVYQYTIR